MKTATALTLIAIGAIMVFAITRTPSFFNLHAAGWVVMLTGVIGLVLPPKRYGWLRKRIIRRPGQAGQTESFEEVEVEPEPRFSSLLAPGGIDMHWNGADTHPDAVAPALDDEEPPVAAPEPPEAPDVPARGAGPARH